MSQVAVVDNSVVMRWFHPSGTKNDLALTGKLLDMLEQGHITPIAPVILAMEFPNVLHHLNRDGELAGHIETALLHWEHLEFSIIGYENGPALYMQTLSEICTQYKISAYDAAYLELAMRENCVLLTLDKSLRKAAQKAGVKTDISA